jgi:Protein of unknown function (DUF3987)
MTDRHARAKAEPAIAGEKTRKLPKQRPSRFEASDDCTYVVVNRADAPILRRCLRADGEPDLDVVWSGEKNFEPQIKGRKVIVAVPSGGPGREQALEAAVRCHAIAAEVSEWPVVGLGSDAAPDMAALEKQWGNEGSVIAKMLAIDEPWLRRIEIPEPSANGNGKHLPDDSQESDEDPTDPVGDVDPVAFHGPLGRLALATQPQTEANALFVLLHLIAFFGAAAGRGPHFILSAQRHRLNLFFGLIGPSGSGRKGTAGHVAKEIWRKADPTFTDENISGGLNSGAGLLYHLRDASERAGKNGNVSDEGVTDKRVVFLESELGSVLMQGHRENDPLLGHLRLFFDSEEVVRSNTKDPTRVTGGHVTLMGHCTPADLEIHLRDTDKANGTANRFLFAFGVRSKLLPKGGDVFDLLDNFLTADLLELKSALEFAKGVGRIRQSPEVEKRWDQLYRGLCETPPGQIGGFFVRAPVIILRLASIFALASRNTFIECDHLDAALAIWNHSDRSLRWIFRSDVDPRAEKLLEALKASPNGLSTTQISKDVFRKNVDAGTIKELLLRLLSHRAIEVREDASKGGRPAKRYYRKQW